MTDTVTLTIDGKEITVPKGTLVIRAAEQLGITIPRFCDHPLLDPVGACRQCMVEVEGQRKPFASCTTSCTDEMVVRTHITSPVARAAQEAQLEFLLINHPLDCPQCDKGGECPLQDQTLAHGPPDTRMVDRKRRYTKPVPISALVALDRERCVLCARCTRFSQEISGDPFIELFERGALEQVAIYEDEPYDSYFSGNVVQICPVGALTATPYRFNARPFDLRSTQGVCNQCSAGCNLRVDTRRGEIQRQLAHTNMAVNEMWNCDRGRFGYTYVAHPDRLTEPAVRGATGMAPAGWRQALARAAEGLKVALDEHGPQAVGVLTGGRLTDEDAYAVSRFARDVLGTDNVDFRLRPRTAEEHGVLRAVAGTTGPTYDEVEAADVVVVAGLDPAEEVPILHLRLRKAWRKHGQRIVAVGPHLGSLEGIDWRWVATPAGGEAAALEALAAGEGSQVEEVAAALRANGARVVVLAGERLAQSPGALPAAAGLATALGAAFAWVPRRNGARGAVDAGLLPGLLPGGRSLDDPGPLAQAWSRLPGEPGLDAGGMLAAAAAGELKALYLIGVDPATDFEDPVLASEALARVDTLVVQELLPTASTHFADVLLPAMAPQERIGSFTTWEGRRQPFTQAVRARGLAQQDWDIVRQLARALGSDLGWETAGDVREEAAPLMEPMRTAAEALAALGATPGVPEAGGRGDGEVDVLLLERLLAPGTTLAGAKELVATAPDATVLVHPQDAARLGVTGGAAVTVRGSAGEVTLPAAVTTAVVPGCVALGRKAADGTPVRLAEAPADGAAGVLRATLAPAASGEGA